MPSSFVLCLVVVSPLVLPPVIPQESPPQSEPKPSTPPVKADAQLRFWVGEWDVLDHGKKIATTSIQLIADGRAYLENYSQPGFSGKSLTFVDEALGKWRQTWVDSQGKVSEFVGEFKDGAVRFEGETHTADGKTIPARMVLKPLDDGRVHQYSERSEDGGKTWVRAYDYTYANRN